jgi:dsDNA-specific endonuclease/ATPase MutS2
MKREFLTELGIEAEKIDKIMAEYGKSVNDAKSKMEERLEEAKLLKEKVSSLEKTAKDTEALLKDNEEMKQKYATLQTESKTQLEQRDKQISHITKKTALTKSLQEKGARYPDLLIKELNLDEVELEGETIKNFDKLYTPLTEKYKDMFTTTEIKGNEPSKGNSQTFDPSSMDWSFIDNIK